MTENNFFSKTHICDNNISILKTITCTLKTKTLLNLKSVKYSLNWGSPTVVEKRID